MWPDWVVRLLTRCPRHLRAMGYLDELLGIRGRHRDWARAWEPHIENTRATILRSARRCPQRRKAVVVGSGWLYDVPVAELAELFREVVLVDLVHPLGVRGAVKRWPNVSLLEADVTGSLEAVYQAGMVPHAFLPVPEPALFCADAEVDLVASVNLLSQLPCMPETYLLEQGSHSAEEVVPYAQGVILDHLDWLRRVPGVAALVCDTEVLTVSQAGRVTARESTVWGLDLGLQGQRWTWALLPRIESPPHHGYHRAVVGIEDFKNPSSG